MKLYSITVEEVLSKTIIVEAENSEEAYNRVFDAMESDVLVLTSDDYEYDSRNITCNGEASEYDALMYQNIEEIEGFDDLINDYYKYPNV